MDTWASPSAFAAPSYSLEKCFADRLSQNLNGTGRISALTGDYSLDPSVLVKYWIEVLEPERSQSRPRRKNLYIEYAEFGKKIGSLTANTLRFYEGGPFQGQEHKAFRASASSKRSWLIAPTARHNQPCQKQEF